MVTQGAHAALSSVRRTRQGDFAGLAAGLAYSNPPRTYYRDGYWTLPLLLRLAPERVADQIELLAAAVGDDGEAPSGVIVAGRHADDFERRRRLDARMAAAHRRPGEWWSDHFDSPLFFVLAVADHAAATGDDALARRHWRRLAAIFDRYLALTGTGPTTSIARAWSRTTLACGSARSTRWRGWRRASIRRWLSGPRRPRLKRARPWARRSGGTITTLITSDRTAGPRTMWRSTR
jgi:hypothetical protein